MRTLDWLNDVDGAYLVNYFLPPIGQQRLKIFSWHWGTLLIGWVDLQAVCQNQGLFEKH